MKLPLFKLTGTEVDGLLREQHESEEAEAVPAESLSTVVQGSEIRAQALIVIVPLKYSSTLNSSSTLFDKEPFFVRSLKMNATPPPHMKGVFTLLFLSILLIHKYDDKRRLHL